MNLFVAVFLAPWLLIDKYPRAFPIVCVVALIVLFTLRALTGWGAE